MAYKDRLSAITLTSIDSSTFTGSYQLINTNGLDHACSVLRIINNSNKDVTVSYDGATNHDFVPATSTFMLATQTNSLPNNQKTLIPQGTQVWVKGAAGSGLVYLAGYYSPVGS